MTDKTYKIDAQRIEPLATGRGACVVSDRIMVDGARVGFMYREEPINGIDSGWRFLSGDEDDAYMEDATLHDVHDVNSVANCDRTIIPWLDEEAGTAIERLEDGTLRRLEPGEWTPRED